MGSPSERLVSRSKMPCLGNVIDPTLGSRRPATVLEAYGGRLAIEATVEPSSGEGGQVGAESAG
jgi:hypothetical protein